MKELWKRTFRRLPRLLCFLPVYLREMTLSNVRVAWDALRPSPRFTPGFIDISLKGYDPIQRWEAACLISMTPGTLSLDMEDDSDLLLVHTLYLSSPEESRLELENLIRQSLGPPDHPDS